MERQLTNGNRGCILTNVGVWSPDSEWIVYDTRSDRDGTRFDGTRIEMVHRETGEVRCLYESRRGAFCGVVTFDPASRADDLSKSAPEGYRVVFILGPEDPTPDWEYGPAHRQGVLVATTDPGAATPLDARNLTPPFTPGALRGGSHVHIFSPDGEWVSFTYNDHVLSLLTASQYNDIDQRNIGVSVPVRAVTVSNTHPRNHDGTYFSVLLTRTVTHPVPGSDEIRLAREEGWIGGAGYRRADGGWQRRALAFQGEVLTEEGQPISEVFVVDLPKDGHDMTLPGDGPLEGTATRRPSPPAGVTQRRLTYTAQRTYPGLQGPRHWLRSSPDGTQIAFLMCDETGVVQLWTVSPNGGTPSQVTNAEWGIASAFTWSPDGCYIAYVADNSVFITEVVTGTSHRLTARTPDITAPLPLACVYSPDGHWIAYQRTVSTGNYTGNQIFIVSSSL